jgi:hypothetical protein
MIVSAGGGHVGRILFCLNTDVAWQLYLSLPREQRTALGGIVVRYGTPFEHASLMLQSAFVPVVRLEVAEQFNQLAKRFNQRWGIVGAAGGQLFLARERHFLDRVPAVPSRRAESGLREMLGATAIGACISS